MTLHPVRTQGLVLGVPQAFRYLEDMQNRIVNFVARHSSVDPDELLSYMNRTDVLANDIGSIVDGNEAVRLGLIDEVGGLSEAIKYLRNEK